MSICPRLPAPSHAENFTPQVWSPNTINYHFLVFIDNLLPLEKSLKHKDSFSFPFYFNANY